MIRKSDQVRDEEKDGRPRQDPQHLSHVQSAHMEEKSELPREKGMSLANLPKLVWEEDGSPPACAHRLLFCALHPACCLLGFWSAEAAS